jgi:hypothetical protein
LEPEFVRSSFGDATLLVNGKKVEVSGAGLLLLRQSELTLEETPALDELISLLRLERIVHRDVSKVREVARSVGLEWAIDFVSAGETRASDPVLADLVDSAFVTSVGDSELAELFELETAVNSRHPLEALSTTASFRAGEWQSVVDVLFRYTRAKPSRWRETSHALKEILRRFPESAKCLECQGQLSVGEHLLWFSIDGLCGGSVVGSLDPTRPNFVVAWREFHGRGRNLLMAALASDDVECLGSFLYSTGEPILIWGLRVAHAGSDVFSASTGLSRSMSMLAVAAQLGGVRCARFVLTNGTKVRAAEVEAAFRGGNAEMVRLLWDSFPRANPLELAMEAVRSWNVAGLRWLLEHKLGALSSSDWVCLFEAACSAGSYACGSSVLARQVRMHVDMLCWVSVRQRFRICMVQFPSGWSGVCCVKGWCR